MITLTITSIGGVKGFTGDQINVLKWCINRPLQARKLSDLTDLAGLVTGVYKPLRQSQINKSENLVSKLMNVLENEYLNNFSITLAKDKLLNLSSGVEFNGNTEEVLNIRIKGKELYDKFLHERIRLNQKLFQDPVASQ